MVWGCFRDLLRRWLLPVLEEVRTVVGNPLFRRDNAKIHTAKLMLSFFKRYAVPLESHPAYSPDLNPIEHVWALPKRQLRADYPDLINDPGGPEKVKLKLAEVLPLCWEKIPPKQLRHCGGLCLLGYRQSLMRRDGTPTTSHCAAGIIPLYFFYSFSVSL